MLFFNRKRIGDEESPSVPRRGPERAVAEEVFMKRKRRMEILLQKFPPRCPYCDGAIKDDPIDLKAEGNPITCPFCQRVFIKFPSPWKVKRKGR